MQEVRRGTNALLLGTRHHRLLASRLASLLSLQHPGHNCLQTESGKSSGWISRCGRLPEQRHTPALPPSFMVVRRKGTASPCRFWRPGRSFRQKIETLAFGWA
jgi:hypothetical protein